MFNPNKTVVKMFVVLYDFSDMPPKAQTFLRQRTFSVWRHSCQSEEVCDTVHLIFNTKKLSTILILVLHFFLFTFNDLKKKEKSPAGVKEVFTE